MRLLRFIAAWLGAAYVALLRLTCRVTFIDDPRPNLRLDDKPYAYAFLHAQQLASVIAGERGTWAMVSRSRDGDLLIPSLRVAGVIAVRGSSRREHRDKGGQEALATLIAVSRSGHPVYFAVDGPRGPRGVVHRGILDLSASTGAWILPAAAHASRKLVLRKTWDQLEIPLPFAHITVRFGAPMQPASPRAKELLQEELARLEQEPI